MSEEKKDKDVETKFIQYDPVSCFTWATRAALELPIRDCISQPSFGCK